MPEPQTPKNVAHEVESPRQDWLMEQYTELASLAGGLAHEIKNPLSTLNLNLQLLAEDFQEGDSPRDKRALRKIETLKRECIRLEDILNDFLKFARVIDLDRQETNLNNVIEELISFHAAQLELAGVVIRTDLAPNLPTVRVDTVFIKQALVNLLLNAQHAMPTGGELILKTRETAGKILIDVIDTGSGMAPELLAKIFRPFFSTRPAGSGLGLPTTKKIIEAHGGRLHVTSEVGKGTNFTIELPAQ